MPASKPLIIEAAINGATPKATNPHVPRTVAEIAACAGACIRACAAIVHHHNDDGLLDGRHATEPHRAVRTRIYERHPGAVLVVLLADVSCVVPTPVK